MSDEFRPERFVISSAVAAELDSKGMAVSKIRHHEDGSAELVLEPLEPEPDHEGEHMKGFIAGCIRSGMQENVCINCGRPWLTRTDEALCPVCNPEHPGYNPDGPTDRARWMLFWRSHFTGVLRARAADHQHRRRLLEHARAEGFRVYPPNASAARIIHNLGHAFAPTLDEQDAEWREGWSRGFDR